MITSASSFQRASSAARSYACAIARSFEKSQSIMRRVTPLHETSQRRFRGATRSSYVRLGRMVASDEQRPRLRMVGLDELDEHAAGRLRMDEGNLVPARALPRRLVDELDAER